MADPITWRNVTGPAIADAARPMESAAALFNAAFNPLQSVLKQREDTTVANMQQQKTNNMDAFMNTLMAAKTAGDMNELQKTGQLQGMLQNFGAAIDQAKAREAMDSRLGILQGRDKEAWAYENAALAHQEEPAINSIKGLLAQGKTAEAAPEIEKLSPQGRAAMFAALDTKQQDLLMRERATKEFDWKADMHPLQMAASRASTDSAVASAAASRSQVKLNNLNFDIAEQERQRKLLENTTAAAMAGNPFRNGVLNASNAALLEKEARDLGFGTDGFTNSQNEKLQQVSQRLTELATKGIDITVMDPATQKPKTVNVPIPFDMARAAILGMQNQGAWKWNTGFADSLESNLKKALDPMKMLATRTGENGQQVVADSPLAAAYQQYLDMGKYALNPAHTGTVGTNSASSTSSGSGSGGKRK